MLVLGLATAWVQGLPAFGFLRGASSNWLLASLVIYVSALPLVPLIFLPCGVKFAEALQAAMARGQKTDDLRRAFADPVVFAGHVFEMLSVFVVLVLMVTKPF